MPSLVRYSQQAEDEPLSLPTGNGGPQNMTDTSDKQTDSQEEQEDVEREEDDEENEEKDVTADDTSTNKTSWLQLDQSQSAVPRYHMWQFVPNKTLILLLHELLFQSSRTIIVSSRFLPNWYIIIMAVIILVHSFMYCKLCLHL